jgi:asparagine synthase (glutamine-hydrolysing)
LLSDSVLVREGILPSKWINNHINTDDVRYVNKHLGIIALEVYYRLFVTKDLLKDEKL